MTVAIAHAAPTAPAPIIPIFMMGPRLCPVTVKIVELNGEQGRRRVQDLKRDTLPVVPAKVGIRYSRALVWRIASHHRPGIPGRPVKPGDDSLDSRAELMQSAAANILNDR
jgi:hypothetical protein